MRAVVLDIEATGLYIKEGHRILEVTCVEMIDGKLTGQQFHVLVNPGRDIPEETIKIHGITNEMVKDKPIFAAIARELREYIGDAQIIITCRTDPDGYTLDRDMLNMEMVKASQPPLKDDQWINIRRWSEAMFGHENAKLDKVLDHYKIDRSKRTLHGATIDALLLAEVYPLILKDYLVFLEKQRPADVVPKANPPSI